MQLISSPLPQILQQWSYSMTKDTWKILLVYIFYVFVLIYETLPRIDIYSTTRTLRPSLQCAFRLYARQCRLSIQLFSHELY